MVIFAYALWAHRFAPQRLPQFGLNPPFPVDQYYNLLAEGFTDGHLYIRKEVPAQLRQLKDPYDSHANYAVRVGTGISNKGSIHDLSYYNGRLYLYFSALPALLIFLPYSLLTSDYLDQATGCALFCTIGFIAQSAVLIRFKKAFWNSITEKQFSFFVFTLGILNFSPLLLRRAAVWEIPVACGFAFGSLSIYFAAKLYLTQKSAARDTVLLGTCVAFAIVCRPTLIFFALLCFVPLWYAFRFRPSKFITTLLCLIAPAFPIGAAAMWYNYARFGNVMDFGIQYQLSGDPRKLILFSPHYVIFGLKAYLFTFRGWVPTFPFLTFLAPSVYPAGYLGIEQTVGLLTCLPALPLGLFFLGRIRRSETFPGFFTLLIGIAVLSLLTVAAFVGATLRYEMEFAPVFALLSTFGMVKVCSVETARRSSVQTAVVFIALAVSILFIFLEMNCPLNLYLNPQMYS